jgi:hypothetical protein
MRVTGKTKPGRFAIGLECVDERQVDAVVVKTVTVRKDHGLAAQPAAAQAPLSRVMISPRYGGAEGS